MVIARTYVEHLVKPTWIIRESIGVDILIFGKSFVVLMIVNRGEQLSTKSGPHQGDWFNRIDESNLGNPWITMRAVFGTSIPLEKWISDIRFNIIGSLSEIREYSKEYGK